MTREGYRDILNPATEAVIDFLIANEYKHGEGINLSSDDPLKCSRHAISSLLGEGNPDGATHAVASLVRAYKMVLAELQND